MKKQLITIAIMAVSFTVKAQVKPIDTTQLSAIIKVQQTAIQAISGCDIPAKQADVIRQQLNDVAQFLAQKRDEIIADERKNAAVKKGEKRP